MRKMLTYTIYIVIYLYLTYIINEVSVNRIHYRIETSTDTEIENNTPIKISDYSYTRC